MADKKRERYARKFLSCSFSKTESDFDNRIGLVSIAHEMRKHTRHVGFSRSERSKIPERELPKCSSCAIPALCNNSARVSRKISRNGNNG